MISETTIHLSRECVRLRERISELEGLVKRFSGSDEADRAQGRLGLSISESRIFGLMVRRGSADYGLLGEALYWDRVDEYPNDPPGAIRTVIKRMRRKIRPLGVDIETEYKFGYTMSDEARERARWLLGLLEDRDEPGAIAARIRVRG